MYVQGPSWLDRMVVGFTTTYAISAHHHRYRLLQQSLSTDILTTSKGNYSNLRARLKVRP